MNQPKYEPNVSQVLKVDFQKELIECIKGNKLLN